MHRICTHMKQGSTYIRNRAANVLKCVTLDVCSGHAVLLRWVLRGGVSEHTVCVLCSCVGFDSIALCRMTCVTTWHTHDEKTTLCACLSPTLFLSLSLFSPSPLFPLSMMLSLSLLLARVRVRLLSISHTVSECAYACQ